MTTTADERARYFSRAAARSRRWPPAIWVALGGSFLIRAAGFSYPFLAYHLAGLHFSARLTGAVLATFGVGWLLGQILAGWLADRIGRRTTLVSAMVTAAATLALLAEVDSVPAVFAVSALAGACYDSPRPVVSALIADTVPDEGGRAAVAGFRHFTTNVAAALTGALGGMLAGAIGVRALIAINAAACLLFAVLALRYLDSGRPAPLPTTEHPPYRVALRDARLWVLWLASIAALICVVGLFSTLPMLMSARGLSATAYGWTQAANAAVVVLLAPVVTPWLSRRARRTGRPLLGPFAIGSLVLGAGMGAAGLATSTDGFALAVALAVPGELVVFIAANNVLNWITPGGARGLYAGIWGTTLAGAVILAPLLGTWSLAHGGARLVAVTTLATGLVGAALCWPLRALIRRSPCSADS
ncbi:MFS transporter [Streptomyces sp. NPDC048248]|uniref:MFS transporter n=1 Tax=Streptomyces sp. NPDC048248 TaxID=3365523 RepID=UPI0037134DEE